MRRAAKRDLAEPDVVAALEGVGCEVEKLNDPDLPDLLVRYRDRLLLIEVKTGRAKLRPGQAEWHERWGANVVKTVRTPREALDAIGFTWAPAKRNAS